MTNEEYKKHVKKLVCKTPTSIGPVDCWLVTNEGSEEKAVFSVEQEALDFTRDLIEDKTYKEYKTKRIEGIFLTYQDLETLFTEHTEEITS